MLQSKRLACPSVVVPESLVSTSNRVFSSEKKGGRCDRVRRSAVHLVVKRATRTCDPAVSGSRTLVGAMTITEDLSTDRREWPEFKGRGS
jgi:hypothetical protein